MFAGKIGGVPVPVVILVVGGGLGLFMYSRNKASQNAVAVDSAGNPISTGAGGAVDQTGGVGSGPGGWVAQFPTTPAASGISTNDQWYQAALTDLLAKNYDPNLSDTALRDYLAGNQLTAQEYTIIGVALRDIGALPAPLPPSGQQPPTTPVIGGQTTPANRPPGVTGLTGGFTGSVGDHVSTGTVWGSPTTTHSGGSWGVTR